MRQTEAEIDESIAAAETGMAEIVAIIEGYLVEKWPHRDTVSFAYACIRENIASEADVAVIALQLAVAIVQIAEARQPLAVTQ